MFTISEYISVKISPIHWVLAEISANYTLVVFDCPQLYYLGYLYPYPCIPVPMHHGYGYLWFWPRLIKTPHTWTWEGLITRSWFHQGSVKFWLVSQVALAPQIILFRVIEDICLNWCTTYEYIFFRILVIFICFHIHIIKWGIISVIFCSLLNFSCWRSHRVTPIPRRIWGRGQSGAWASPIYIIIIKYLMDNIIVDENTLVTLNPLPYPATPIPKKTLPSFNPSTTSS